MGLEPTTFCLGIIGCFVQVDVWMTISVLFTP
jgi:hypothetical protein